MSADLVTWLRQQLDEDELAAMGGRHNPRRSDLRWQCSASRLPGIGHTVGTERGELIAMVEAGVDAEHIALHDPAAVLADIAAKRLIVERAEQYARWAANDEAPGFQALHEAGKLMVRYLASAYADRTGYRDEWRPA